MSSPSPLSSADLQRLLALPDLTRQPCHAVAQMVDLVAQAAQQVAEAQGLPLASRRVAGNPVAHAQHNYHLLGYDPQSVMLSQAHTQWVDNEHLLRTQTTSVILEQLQSLAADPQPMLLLAPGMVYRRDVRDRTHCGQPHQVDVWWLVPREQQPQAPGPWLRALMERVLPGTSLDLVSTAHPYTQQGIEVQARWQNQWLEIGEGGLIDPALLERLGLDPNNWGGVASGWGLDRLVMVRKALPDIRLLRDPLPAIAKQMKHLDAWKEISRQPTAARELSLARPPEESEEALTEAVLTALPQEAEGCLQEIRAGGTWAYEELPEVARQRLGLMEGQVNRLITLVWQSPSRSIARQQVNEWSRQVYRACHAGSSWTYCP